MASVSKPDPPETLDEKIERFQAEVRQIVAEYREPAWVQFVERHPAVLGVLIWLAFAATLVFAGTAQSIVTGGCK